MTALVVDAIDAAAPLAVLVPMAVVALALDAVDGWVAGAPAPPARSAPASTWRSTPS